MERKIINKQNNSSRCVVCGDQNSFSLNTRFYEVENGELVAIFQTKDHHQSYPGRVHGGMAAAILDETIGRAICVQEPGTWAVTVELNMKYKRPLPTDAKLKAVARITRNTRKIFEGEGEILLEDGAVAVSAWGKYMKLPVDQIADEEFMKNQWYRLEEEDPEWV
ncbi:MAG: PaaI family thioesterase [Anaerovorax sp.]